MQDTIDRYLRHTKDRVSSKPVSEENMQVNKENIHNIEYNLDRVTY